MKDDSSYSPLLSNSVSDVEIKATSQGPAVLSVEDLNKQIRDMIETGFQLVWVKAEISNFKPHTSGHFYFSLKDSKSQIKAVMFRGHNARLKFKPHDGLEVLIRGRVTVYEPRGDYQIAVELMEPVGAGALQKAFEQLKIKLKNEGLFDLAKKRPLPTLPRQIAIITSPTGAAIRDMIQVLTRRFKAVNILVIPTLVQGESAAPMICQALDKAYRLPEVDVIIVGRGGGSIEDLWAFNNEELARKISQSPVPIVSAVGHEVDFTIADFVADLRAPTPSAAAELVVKNAADLVQRVESQKRLLTHTMLKLLKMERQKLNSLARALVDPKKKLQDLILRRDELETRLIQAADRFLEKKKLYLKLKTDKLVRPEQTLNRLKNQIQILNMKLGHLMNQKLDSKMSRLRQTMVGLDSLSPLKVVDRGYSLVSKDQIIIKSTQQLKIGDQIDIQLADGKVTAEVKQLQKKGEGHGF